MRNESGLVPLGCAVLLEYYQPERKESMIFIPEKVEDRDVLIEQRAIVVEVGANAWKDEKEPRAWPGDKVMVTKYAGYSAVGPADGRRYRIVNDMDIFARIVEEK